jgi:hypothetical protein
MFSTGESFADQFRQCIFWILDQKEGIKTSALALRLEEIRKKKEAEERALELTPMVPLDNLLQISRQN